MTALDRRGIAIWKARTLVEGAALACGLVMGGTIGWGTVWFLVSIGPAVQFSYTDSTRKQTGNPARSCSDLPGYYVS